MNKTDRKNKTNLTVRWPEHGKLFTIKELATLNPEFIEITLRVRVDKAIKKDHTVAVVGTKNVGKGRPTTILTMNPVTQEFLKAAYASGIQPPEDGKPIVSVIDVKTTPISTADSAVPDIQVEIPVAETDPVSA